jgi:hypothetical protein
MGDAEDLFAVVFEQFSKGDSSSPTLSGCYQLLLDPASKIANLRGIVVHIPTALSLRQSRQKTISFLPKDNSNA